MPNFDKEAWKREGRWVIYPVVVASALLLASLLCNWPKGVRDWSGNWTFRLAVLVPAVLIGQACKRFFAKKG